MPCQTFREACMMHHGLLDNDNAWHLTMQEAAMSAPPPALRTLFTIIITQCNPSNIMQL